jgi:2,3-bisphosphoglycerate-dependent phosphoglycerate mutase
MKCYFICRLWMISTLTCVFALLNCTINTKNNMVAQPIGSITAQQIIQTDGQTITLPGANDSSSIILFCVRHCEKAKDGTKDPDLTAEGQARAAQLGRILADAQLTRVCATPYKRTQQTAEAVREKTTQKISLETYSPDAQDVFVESLLAGGGDKRYLIVGHQNTIPALLNHLLGEVKYYNLGDYEYDKMFIIKTKGVGQTEVLQASY